MVASIPYIMILISAKLISGNRHAIPIDNGALVIHKGLIKAVGISKNIIARFTGHRVLRLSNSVLMPGIVNTHIHLELPPLLDSIYARTFPDWVINLILAKKNLIRPDYASAVSENLRALIRTGTTTVGEICTHGVSPSLIKKAGLRAEIFHEIIAMNTKVRTPRHPSFFVLRPSSLIRHGLSPHTPYTVSESVLREIAGMNKTRNIRLAMHIAESIEEIRLLRREKSGLEKIYQYAHWDLSRAPRGRSSFEYLHKIGFLTNRLLAVHAVQVTDEDIRLIKKLRTSIAHCPRSNKELGVGRLPLKKFLNAGITVGLGTDSLASVPTLNMWDEMRYAYKIHRQDGVSAKDIFRIATIGGAKALGMDKEIGTLEPGKKADIIAVPIPSRKSGDIYSDLLRETNSCIMSMVNGKIIYPLQRTQRSK